MRLSQRPILPFIYFLCLLPIDRFLALHILVIGWLVVFFLPIKNWWQMGVLLFCSLLHDIAYVYPLGTSGTVFFITLFLLSQPKIHKVWGITLGMFIVAQSFSFLDYGRVQFDTMTIVRVIFTVIFGYFIFIRQKNDTRTY